MTDAKVINPNKVIKYSDNDPRFNFMIQDSDEYNRQILPRGMRIVCNRASAKIFNGSDENYAQPNDPDFDGIVIKNVENYPVRIALRANREYPSKRALSCGSERYENCISSGLDKEYDTCRLEVNLDVNTDDDPMSSLDADLNSQGYTKNILSPDGLKKFKNLKKNSFYDKSFIPKRTASNEKVVVDYSPDTGPVINANPDKITKVDENPELIEHYSAQFSDVANEICGKCMGFCCFCCPSWLTPEESFIICIILCGLCILLPLITSALNFIPI